jgi:hypothetical protein
MDFQSNIHAGIFVILGLLVFVLLLLLLLMLLK